MTEVFVTGSHHKTQIQESVAVMTMAAHLSSSALPPSLFLPHGSGGGLPDGSPAGH